MASVRIKKKYDRGKNLNSHHNAMGPPGNKNAEKHGFFSKWLLEETIAIIGEMPDDPLELLWDNIQLQFVAIIVRKKRYISIFITFDIVKSG